MRNDPTILRSEERLFGALAHLAAAIPAWGLAINLGFWIYFKERSRELTFHIQQAMLFQGLLFAISIPWFVLQILGRIIEKLAPRLGSLVLDLNSFMMVLALTIFVGTCLWGAVQTYSGRPFYYPILGRRVYQGSLRKTSVEE